MSYLSQALMPMQTALHAQLADGYAWHKAIWEAFPGRPDAQRDFLFRIDARTRAYRILLLSAVMPTDTPLLKWQSKEVAPGFLGHVRYRFQLKANPTFRRNKDKRRIALYKEEDLHEWLADKLKGAGALLEEPVAIGAPVDEFLNDERFMQGRKPTTRHDPKHVSVDFEGVLRVQDSAAFTAAFYKGIGSAKGFGYGLLMLQPIH